MKQIIILFFIVLFINNKTYAQVQNEDTAAHKFAGTWRWTSGNDTVEVVLQMQIVNWYSFTAEDVVGWHRYVRNGQLVESSLNLVGTQQILNSEDITCTLYGGTHSPNELLLSVFDNAYDKREELRLQMLPNSLTQATWQLQDPRGIYSGPEGTFTLSTLPKNLILTKQ